MSYLLGFFIITSFKQTENQSTKNNDYPSHIVKHFNPQLFHNYLYF